jgi:uncharacterized protein
MIMKSRKEKGWLTGLQRMMWPKKSYLRSFRYYGKRILRIRATPKALAIGFSAGVFAAFSPALGLHILIAIALAWGLGGNVIAAALGTAAANPLTFPVMIAGEFKIGRLAFGGDDALPLPLHVIGTKLSHFDFAGTWEPLFKPLLAGSLVLGVVFAAISYVLVLSAANSFEARRHQRKLQREIATQ